MAKRTSKNINKKKQKKMKKSKIKQHIIQVFLLSLILFAVVFVIYKIIELAVHPTDSFLIENGKISQEESVVGYLIRDEKIIQTSNNEKKLVQIKNEGERVSVGEAVFRYEATDEEEINKKIEELNIQIQEAMNGQTNVFSSSDINALEEQIKIKIEGIQKKNNIQEIEEIKKDINAYITKKAKISGELSPAGSYINNLINERTNLEKQLKNSSQQENATIGGIVSYRVDGLEEKLTPSDFENLSSEKLEDLNLITGQIVTTSTTSAKVINNFECYIAIWSNTKEAKKAQIGDKLKIRISATQEIPAEIEYIKEEEKDRLIILKITQGVEKLTNYRKISLDVIWWEEDGLRVPNTSIIYENGLSYVIRTKAGVLNKILVKIVKENDKYSIITNYKTEELKNMEYTVESISNMKKINIYDEILANPDIEEIAKKLD